MKNASEITQILSGERLIEMILGFNIRQYFGWKLALAVKRSAGSKSQENKCRVSLQPK